MEEVDAKKGNHRSLRQECKFRKEKRSNFNKFFREAGLKLLYLSD